MQIVYNSIRPAVLRSTLRYVAEFMPFVDSVIVVTREEYMSDVGQIDSRILVIDDRELYQNIDLVTDHAQRNFLLRTALANHPRVAAQFLMSDDDFRPLEPVNATYYKLNGKYQPYYFYTLPAWASMLKSTSRRTSYDWGSLNSGDLLRRLNHSTLMFSSHMPQIVDKEILKSSVVDCVALLDRYSSLTEWEIYFNFAIDRYSARFHPPRPFEVLGWPDRPHWPWHVRPGRFVFENYDRLAYEVGGLFDGLPDEFDDRNHDRVTTEKIQRYEDFFARDQLRSTRKERKKKNGLNRKLLRQAKIQLRSAKWAGKKRCLTVGRPSSESDQRRIYVAGIFQFGTGLATTAAILNKTLLKCGAGISTETIDVSANFRRPALASSRKVNRGQPPHGSGTIVACLNPPEASRFFRATSMLRLAGKHRVGYWWWEYPGFPENWETYAADCDEVWVSSRFILENWQPILDVPIRYVPLDLRDEDLKPARVQLDDSQPVRFLTVINLSSTLDRKNIAGAIEVFERVRAAAKRPISLTIKVGRLGEYPDRYLDFLKLNVRQPGIDVIVSELTDSAFDRLIEDHDFYLSMHRAEGLGIPLAKAMGRGKVVVATRWSGNLDYMTEQSSLLVDFVPTVIRDENGNSQKDLLCAEPLIDDAVEKILHVLNRPEQLLEIGRQAQRRIVDVSEFGLDYNRRQFAANGLHPKLLDGCVNTSETGRRNSD